MRIAKIQTGSKTRTLYIAEGAERKRLGRLAQKIALFERAAAERAGTSAVAHGFVAGRNCMTMAVAHIGYDVTVSVDISDWFAHVWPDHLVVAGLSAERAKKCCPDGAAHQGLPTSPACANLAAVALDAALLSALSRGQLPWVYTRYADDICVSWRAPTVRGIAEAWIGGIAEIVAAHDWSLSARKTRIQYATAGRRIICGLSVGPTDVLPTRHTRRRLRAAGHTAPGSAEWRGLREWSACKLPGAARAGLTNRVLATTED